MSWPSRVITAPRSGGSSSARTRFRPKFPARRRDDKRARYADVLAAQVRLSFPTQVVAQMVKERRDAGGSPGCATRCHAFLTEHQGKFEIGMQPVEQYIARNQLQVAARQCQRRSRASSASIRSRRRTRAMNALLKSGIDSAYAVARYDQDQFVRAFKDELGGEANARLIHAKAQQVHNLVPEYRYFLPDGRHRTGDRRA